MSQRENRITASDLVQSAGCMHSYHLNLFGDPSLRRRESAAEKYMKAAGISFQQKAAERLGIGGSAVRYDSLEAGHLQTLEWMRQGAEYIYQGILLGEDLAGIPDLLRKTPGTSRFGNYCYVPVEIKNHSALLYSDRLQLCFYARLLGTVQGTRPSSGFVLSPDFEFREIPFSPKLERQATELLRQMRLVNKGELETRPFRCSSCVHCFWSDYCAEGWEKRDHISLISGLSAVMAKKLEDAGIDSCRTLASARAEEIEAIVKAPAASCRRFIDAARSRTLKTPIMLSPPEFPAAEPLYFYDIETCDDIVFCHGIIRREGEKVEERCFFADDLSSEKEIWHGLLDFMARDEKPVVLCWTFYERYFMKRLWRRYRGNEKGYRNLSASLEDQCAFVREHFALPCRGYSIKSVAPYFGFEWRAQDANGMNCVAWYHDWLETRSPELKRKIMEYNTDDVRAMHVIDSSLRKFCGALPRTSR